MARVGVELLGRRDLDDLAQVHHGHARCLRVGASLWMTSASPMIEPTVIRGLSDAYGSWKMICISFRSARSDRLSSVVTLRPWKLTSPEVGSINLRMERPVIDFPQ